MTQSMPTGNNTGVSESDIASSAGGKLRGVGTSSTTSTTASKQWQIGTGSIRESEKKPTGLRFVQWIHHDPREAAGLTPRQNPPERFTCK